MRQDGLEVQPSGVDFIPADLAYLGINNVVVTQAGGKCEHGVYIPANHEDQDRAQYCSICNPTVPKQMSDGSYDWCSPVTEMEIYSVKSDGFRPKLLLFHPIMKKMSPKFKTTVITHFPDGTYEAKTYGRPETSDSNNPPA